MVLDAPDGEHETRTSYRGEAIFQANAVDAITVAVEERPLLVIIQPGANDLLLTVQEDRAAPQGGLRGSADLAFLPQHDIRMSFVGLSFPEDLLDLDPSQLIGEPTTVTIDAPELSLNNSQFTLPSGFMLQLGKKSFTERKPFCDRARNAELLDCYFLHAPPSFRSVWTLSGSLRLSEVTPFATNISSGGVTFDFISGVFGAWAHSARAPMLMSGELVDQDLALDSALRVLSIVRAPMIPPGAQATLFAASDPFGTGFMPLGIAAVHDDDGDGFADSADHPFGFASDASPRGTIAIASAPRYGAEPFAWMLLAVDQLKRAFSMRVAHDIFDGELLAFPANARVAVDGALEAQVDPRANVVRYDVQADVGVARVYAPAGVRVALPRVASARVVRVVEAAEIAGPFSDLWTFPRRAEVSAFAVRSF